jgi:hypothetical protein
VNNSQNRVDSAWGAAFAASYDRARSAGQSPQEAAAGARRSADEAAMAADIAIGDALAAALEHQKREPHGVIQRALSSMQSTRASLLLNFERLTGARWEQAGPAAPASQGCGHRWCSRCAPAQTETVEGQ